jgi:cysteinyl-tRNA synthetase
MEWDSPWGVGFPGWHIECSAMSVKYLGEHFDIHCGGVDFINLHHTNELAQSEASIGKEPWVNYWVHGEFLNLKNGEKMAKSTGNFLTINSEFINKNISPLVYRYATFGVHYRKQMEWNNEIVASANTSYNNLLNKVRVLGTDIGNLNMELKERFIENINDDLNMPKALATLNEVFKYGISNEDKLATILDFDKVLGLDLNKIKEIKIEIPEEVETIAKDRLIARSKMDWQKSDELRDKIKDLGYEIKDTDGGYEITKI